MRAFVRAAVKQASDEGRTPREVLEDIIVGRFKSEARNGRTIVSTSKGSSSVSYTIPDGLGPADVVMLAEEALEWVESQPNPDAPDLSGFRRVARLRASFARASA